MSHNIIDSSITFFNNPVHNNTIFTNDFRYFLPFGYKVQVGGKKYEINYPLYFQYQDDRFVMNSPLFGIYLDEATLSKLNNSLASDVDFLWNCYGLSKSEELDASAQELREAVLKYIRLVD